MLLMQSKRIFTDFLAGIGHIPVLFEPFISRRHSETLLWRRGGHLWDTPEAYVSTLASLTERTGADVYFVDMRTRKSEEKQGLIDAVNRLRRDRAHLGAGFICGSEEDIAVCASAADCVCLYGYDGNCASLPCPAVIMDGTPERACALNACGWYAAESAEKYLADYGKKLRILGGLGVDSILSSGPVTIYSRIEALFSDYRGQWACGTGGSIADENYLELISVLGGFARMRE